MSEKTLSEDLLSYSEGMEKDARDGRDYRTGDIRAVAGYIKRKANGVAQLESQIDAMRDFMALLYLGIREGRDEAFEALDEKTKNLINEVWFERLEEDDE